MSGTKNSTKQELTCAKCGTTSPDLHYRSGKMRLCIDCQGYQNLTTKKTGGGVLFSLEEFLEWKRSDPARRLCTYCGLDGASLYALDAANPRTGRRYEVIGVDRIDNDRPYELDNIQPCCPLCNGIKSSTLSQEEMLGLGAHLQAIWQQRLR